MRIYSYTAFILYWSFEPQLLNWKCFPYSVKLFSISLLFTHSHCYPSLYEMRCVCVCVCVSVRCVQACAHTLMCACVHVWAIWFFSLYACEADVKACAFSLPRPSSVQPQQGLSRARIKGAREEEKVPPQLIWPLWGEEHYSHWCSGRMAKTPRSFRKGLFKVWCDPKDWVGRWVLSPLWGRWEHCPCSATLIPLWTIGSLSWMGSQVVHFCFTRHWRGLLC